MDEQTKAIIEAAKEVVKEARSNNIAVFEVDGKKVHCDLVRVDVMKSLANALTKGGHW